MMFCGYCLILILGFGPVFDVIGLLVGWLNNMLLSCVIFFPGTDDCALFLWRQVLSF